MNLSMRYNTETTEELSLLPFLTTNTNRKGVSVMIEQQLSLPLGKIKRICKVVWCDNIHDSRGYCNRHSHQFRRYGKIKSHTQKDPNIIICEGDICWIVLTDALGEPITEAIIDREDKERVEKHRWGLTHDYPWNNTVGRLHHFVLGFHRSINLECDHKNRITLDCRKNNLRICTTAENSFNKALRKDNTSGFKGVSWEGRREKWVAEIKAFGKKYYLGQFGDVIDAAKAYNKAAQKHFEGFAWLNDV